MEEDKEEKEERRVQSVLLKRFRELPNQNKVWNNHEIMKNQERMKKIMEEEKKKKRPRIRRKIQVSESQKNILESFNKIKNIQNIKADQIINEGGVLGPESEMMLISNEEDKDFKKGEKTVRFIWKGKKLSEEVKRIAMQRTLKLTDATRIILAEPNYFT